MRRITGLVLIICLILMTAAGCGRTAEVPREDPPDTDGAAAPDEEEENGEAGREEKYLDFKVQYIRTDGYADGEDYPKTVWITSAAELEAYYSANRDRYDLESRDNPYSDQATGFLDAVGGYDDAFFEKHDLLFVVLEEGSGSVRHEVTGLKAVPAQDTGYTLQPEIERIVPEAGTDDMAEWHIVIEIGREYGKSAAEAVVPVISTRYAADAAGEASGADTASVAGPYGQISVSLPAAWTAEAAPIDSGRLTYGLYGLILKPEDAAGGQMELYCTDSFGVCGTGLAEGKTELAGFSATVGTYDGQAHWDFITFGNDGPQIVAQHTDCSSWTAAMWDEAMAVLDTMKFDERIAEGGAGQYISESENSALSLMMSVSRVTAGGLTVRFRQYDSLDGTDLLYGSSYTLARLEGNDWTEVLVIRDDPRFDGPDYTIPPQGEAEWEISWERLYGELTPGTYRIMKTVWARRENRDVAEPYSLTAQFILAG